MKKQIAYIVLAAVVFLSPLLRAASSTPPFHEGATPGSDPRNNPAYQVEKGQYHGQTAHVQEPIHGWLNQNIN